MIAAWGRRDRLALAALVVAALALRLAHRIDHDEDIDALRFALGVDRFDVAALRPHAPYYPVFIAAAKLVALLGASPRAALGIVSAASGAAAVAFTALLARDAASPGAGHPPWTPRRAALAAAALALASPALWLASEKLLSDMAGTAAFTAALWLCARARLRERAGDAGAARRARTTALVLLGAALGVRLSYFPIAAACLVVIARTEARAAGGGRAALRVWAGRAGDLAAGALAWLVPLVLAAPPRDLVATTWTQGLGHFTRWGGSAITVPSPAARLGGAAWGLWANALGGAWPDAPAARWIGAPIVALLLGAAARAAWRRRGEPRAQPELWAAGIAYFAWALLGQNTAFKPRHWLPLVPLLIAAMAVGAGALAARGPRRALRPLPAAAIAILAAQWLADGLSLVREHRAPSPAAAIVAFLRDHPGEDRPILTLDLGRMIEEGAPGHRPRRVTGDAELLRAVAEAGPAGALITGEALSATARASLAARGYAVSVVFGRPRSRYVDALWSELVLLEARPPLSP